jgi:hypothetical protein
MASDVREQITEWIMGADTCFLIGAGCSVCAGKPVIGELTTKVLADAPAKLSEQYIGLKPVGDRSATIEDLITYLVRYKDILNTISKNDGHNITIAEIDEWLTLIKKKIVATIADEWKSSDHHLRFLQRVRNPREGRPRDIFCLNYDTAVEASLDELRLPYVDGFRGTNRAWFDPEIFEEGGTSSAQFRIFKLHGSINWTRDSAGHVRRGRNANEDAGNETIVVYPSEQKYLQTQYGVYETLMIKFRNRLRQTGANNCLVVLGYSFNDEHINEAICDAVIATNSNLTVVAFVGPEKDRGKQIARMQAISDRCDHRFNAFIGNGENAHFVGHALDAADAKIVTDAELWRFEKLVDFIAGEGP